MGDKQIMTKNYMEALLRASLLLGEPHSAVPVSNITISAVHCAGRRHILRPRCKITVEPDDSVPLPIADAGMEEYLILYPAPEPPHS